MRAFETITRLILTNSELNTHGNRAEDLDWDRGWLEAQLCSGEIKARQVPQTKTAVDIVALAARGLLLEAIWPSYLNFRLLRTSRRPGHWRAAITPCQQSGNFIRDRTKEAAK
jgi:hypothetical protein